MKEVNRSAITGKFVTKSYAEVNSETTVKETVDDENEQVAELFTEVREHLLKADEALAQIEALTE